MPKAKATATSRNLTGQVCDLCGLPLRAGRTEAVMGDRTYRFCCTGCRQVFSILLQASGSADPAAFRQTELFRKCRESGIIPAAADEIPSPAATPAEVPAAPVASLSVTLKVEHMGCPACAWLIETVLSRTPGVFSATCTFVTDRLKVHYDPAATDPGRIAAAVGAYGYLAAPADEARSAEARRREWSRFGVSAFLSMNVMMLSAALYFGFFTELTAEAVASISWPMAVMATLVLGYGGGEILRRAWGGLTCAAFSMESLISIGVLSAFGFSTFNLLRGSIHLYYDTVCMLVTLVLLGKMLERRARDQVLEEMEGFLALMPAKVQIVSEGFPQGRFVAAEQLVSGDLFRIDAGDIVAADGIVVSGSGAADESSITGEPTPIPKKPGDAIRSGSRVHRGSLTVCADKVGPDSTLGQMLVVVQNTLASKVPAEGRTDKILRWFVPVILMLAGATAAAVWLAGLGAETAMLRAVTVTVIACPCALGVAIPLARVAGIALAAKNGMLVRSFTAFERSETIDTVVFDKTGTVTRGAWRLLGIVALGEFPSETALALASGMEQAGSHPIAFELQRAARDRRLRPERVAVVQAEENGVSALWKGFEVKIGSSEFLADEFSGWEYRIAALSEQETGRSLVYLSAGGRPAAVFVFGDELRGGMAEAIAALRQKGLALALVSGDGVETTQLVGRKLGISETYGGQLPADKARFVSELRRRGKTVAMVGDGINDAPALAQADLSLAVFSGGNLGRDVADVTLMRSDPDQIPAFIDFARSVNRTIRQNLILTFLYNLISIPVAMSGLLSPLVAVCAMLLSSLSVIGNTYLLVRKYS
jgi:heavy metal translocating P-type ATPase